MVKAFCVGQAKSGTASLAGLLSKYRVAHEPERGETLDLVVKASRGELSDAAVSTYLVNRDERLNLEYDVAWANQFMMNHLVRTFPDALFIVLVRDPRTWLQSIVGHLTSREIPPEVRVFLDWWFRPDLYPHVAHDQALESYGLYAVDAFLNAWRWHVSASHDQIPPGRRLIIKTQTLNQSHQQIADFLDIPLGSLDVERGHRNRSTASVSVASLVDPSYLDDRIQAICGKLMAQLFFD